MATPLGIEPKLQSSQNCVLSVERRDPSKRWEKIVALKPH